MMPCAFCRWCQTGPFAFVSILSALTVARRPVFLEDRARKDLKNERWSPSRLHADFF